MTVFQGTATCELSKMTSLQNEFDVRLPPIQALVDRQGVHSNTIPGKQNPNKNQIPRKQNKPHLIPQEVQQPTRILLPNHQNKVPGKLKSHTVNTPEHPGGQLMEQTNAYGTFLSQEVHSNTIPGKQNPNKNQIPGKQNKPNSIPREVQQPNGNMIPSNQNKVPGKLKSHTANTLECPGGQLTEQTNA